MKRTQKRIEVEASLMAFGTMGAIIWLVDFIGIIHEPMTAFLCGVIMVRLGYDLWTAYSKI